MKKTCYSKFYSLFLLIILISINFINGCSKDQDDFESTQCNDFGEIRFKEYYLNNNVFNKGNRTDYNQCVFLEKKDGVYEFGWTWRWPSYPIESSTAFPEIAYGWGWGFYAPSTTKLPRQIGAIKDIDVSFDVSTSATGIYNLTFDLWLTSKYTLNERQYITREVMILLDITRPGGTGANFVKRVNIDGEEYDLHMSNDWFSWTYFAFVKVIPRYSGNIKLHKFLNLLKDEGYISVNEYLATIEFGNEVWEGTGETRVRNYAVSVN